VGVKEILRHCRQFAINSVTNAPRRLF